MLGEVFQGPLKLLKPALQKDRAKNPEQVLLWVDHLLPANHPSEEFAEKSEEKEPTLASHWGVKNPVEKIKICLH